jgi:hypothetical protein
MDERIIAIIGADAGAQHKYFDTFQRSEHLEPEKALLMAILEDAIHLYQKYAAARDRAGKEQFHEVEEWIMHQGSDWLFDFDNVCALLGLDPQYLRRGLRQLKLAPVKPGAKERRRALHGQAA